MCVCIALSIKLAARLHPSLLCSAVLQLCLTLSASFSRGSAMVGTDKWYNRATFFYTEEAAAPILNVAWYLPTHQSKPFQRSAPNSALFNS